MSPLCSVFPWDNVGRNDVMMHSLAGVQSCILALVAQLLSDRKLLKGKVLTLLITIEQPIGFIYGASQLSRYHSLLPSWHRRTQIIKLNLVKLFQRTEANLSFSQVSR